MGVSGSLQVKDGKYYAVLSLRTNELTKKEKSNTEPNGFQQVLKSKGIKSGQRNFSMKSAVSIQNAMWTTAICILPIIWLSGLMKLSRKSGRIHTEAIREMWETILCRTFIRGE